MHFELKKNKINETCVTFFFFNHSNKENMITSSQNAVIEYYQKSLHYLFIDSNFRFSNDMYATLSEIELFFKAPTILLELRKEKNALNKIFFFIFLSILMKIVPISTVYKFFKCLQNLFLYVNHPQKIFLYMPKCLHKSDVKFQKPS